VEDASYRSKLGAFRTAMVMKLKVICKLRSFKVPIKYKRFLNDNIALLKNVASPNKPTGKKMRTLYC